MGTDLGCVRVDASAVADRVLSPSATEPEVSAHTGNAPLRGPWVHDPQRLIDSLHNDTILRADVAPKNRLKSAQRRRVVAVLLAEHGPLCWLCGNALDGKPTLDHIVPRSHGGRNAIANLRLAHQACNERRSNGPVPTLLLTRAMRVSAIAAAARDGGDAEQAPGNAPQSGGTAASPDLHGGIA